MMDDEISCIPVRFAFDEELFARWALPLPLPRHHHLDFSKQGM